MLVLADDLIYKLRSYLSRVGYKTTSKISNYILRTWKKDNMFKIGDAETKISVTTWNGAVRVHFRKFYQSKFDRRKFYPSRQGIALTLMEWRDLKALVSEVDEMVECTQIMLDGDDNEIEMQTQRAPFQRQFGVNEEEEKEEEQSNLQQVNQEIISEILKVNEETQEYKKIKLAPPENFDTNANFAFEFQE